MKHTKKLRHLLILGCFLIYPLAGWAEDQAEDLQCIHIGFVNKIKGSAHGFELGAVNKVKKDFKGFQAAVFYNNTQEEMHGLQLGIVNHTGSLYGIQIGILNFNDDTRYLGFFPFINVAF